MNAVEIEIPKLSPLKRNVELTVNSFVHHQSSEVRKMLTDQPSTAIAILKHVWDQEYKDLRKRVLMNKYWRCTKDNTSLAKLMFDLGKYRGRKDKKKLSSTVNEVKNKYNNLRRACRLADISWSKFHRFTYVKLEGRKKPQYTRKLTAAQIAEIQAHYTSDEVSFPLPDKKYANKRFLCTSVTKCTKMYNMLATTTRKISTATFYKYKPKAVKLQGHIPFRQSCCKKCQNFENITNEAAKYLYGVPHNIGDCIDQSMCSYTGYFPKIQCILRTCNDCGVNKFKDKILAANRDKLSDARKRFLVKLWITKTERKEGKMQSFLHWKFGRCSYLQLINLLQKHITSMAEHSFMASWNYWQYKLARRNIIEGDVIMVHDFAQNYLCTHQNEAGHCDAHSGTLFVYTVQVYGHP